MKFFEFGMGGILAFFKANTNPCKMTNKLILIFIPLLFINCFGETSKTIRQNYPALRTGNKQLKENFDICVSITESTIKRWVSDAEFKKHFNFSVRATGFEYANVVKHVDDSLTALPQIYKMYYDFIINGDTTSIFLMEFDSTLHINYYRYYYLQAFRKFIDGDLNITTTKAKEIAIANGVKGDNLEPIFQCTRDYPDTLNNINANYYWDIKSDCDGCPFVTIDAKNGKVISRGQIKFMY